MTTKSGIFLFLSLGLVIGLGAGCAALGQSHIFRGSEISPASPAPDIRLTDQYGRTFRMADQKGQVVIVFFGYTSCPDVCPATLGQFQQLRRLLGSKAAERVRFVFITIDPEYDDVSRLREHLSRLDPEAIGLTGSLADLQPVWESYGVYREQLASGAGTSRLFTHSARLYVIDAAGNLRVTYPFGTQTQDIAEDVLYLLSER